MLIGTGVNLSLRTGVQSRGTTGAMGSVQVRKLIQADAVVPDLYANEKTQIDPFDSKEAPGLRLSVQTLSAPITWGLAIANSVLVETISQVLE